LDKLKLKVHVFFNRPSLLSQLLVLWHL